MDTLIRGTQRARRQAETPLIVLCRFSGPALTNPTRPRAVKTRERLAAWVRSLGITDKELSPTHSWRHLFKTIAARAEIADRMSDAITGHAPATVAGRYVHPEAKDMAAALAKFPRYTI